MTTLTSLLSPHLTDDPPLELGPAPGATARCRHCAQHLTADQLGWRHDQPTGFGWLCRDGQHLAQADPHTITPPIIGTRDDRSGGGRGQAITHEQRIVHQHHRRLSRGHLPSAALGG